MKTLSFVVVITIPLLFTDATITPTFRAFLRRRYGREVERLLARDDYGIGGSFGGGNHLARTPTNRRPVIYVHGVGQIAGDLGVLQWYLHVRGYRDEEVFATSYGEPGRRSKLLVDPMKCDYVKQIRRMLVTVSDYANWTVDVIAFSMGSPIARKAILGGNCVDTGENLGDPLTDNIHSFLGIAGANHGALFCLADEYSECNDVNGLSCESKFLADINSNQHYEGQNVYSLLTTRDQVVGYDVCNQVTTKVPASDRTVTITTQDHNGVLIFTGHIQYNLLYNGTA